MRVLSRSEPGYPPALEDLSDPPACVWVRGIVPPGRAVAVVGARGADAAGRAFAFELGRALGRAGLWVVSGGARGIDAAAHAGALAAAAPTVVVLACGVDISYPPEHGPLFARILGAGALLSELPPGSPPLRRRFLRRNRLIAALGCACVVVQADDRSGALSTAGVAHRLGRPVLAVPWNPGAPLGRGTARLLANCAQVATAVEDVIHAVGMVPTVETAIGARGASGGALRVAGTPGGGPGRGGLAGALLGRLQVSPAHLDELVVASGAKLPEVSTTLLTLELEGLVLRTDCGRYELLRAY